MDIVDKRTEHLVYGYIRRFERSDVSKRSHIPSSIQQLILTFYYLPVRFDTVPLEYRVCIENNGLCIHRPETGRAAHQMGQFIAGCSIQAWDKGIHEVCMKCISAQDDVLGVVSNINVCTGDKWIASRSIDAVTYGLYGSGIIMTNEDKNDWADIRQRTGVKWKRNDIISLKTDCNAWTITYFINEQQVGDTHPIQPNLTYYPVLATQNDDVQYEWV